jgi:hypothetical protein
MAVFNAKKKLAPYLAMRLNVMRNAAWGRRESFRT